jgi:ribosomal protein S18 acetylase RimI-like enzyme
VVTSGGRIEIRQADLADPRDAEALVRVLDAYARDPMGGGTPLAVETRRRLPHLLREHPTTVALLAWSGDEAVGLAVCFVGISTFAARPLLNIHDLAVVPAYRGRGVGRALLEAAAEAARARGCCKLTLEVQDTNHRARAVYARFGFEDFVIGQSGPTRFLAKPLA